LVGGYTGYRRSGSVVLRMNEITLGLRYVKLG